MDSEPERGRIGYLLSKYPSANHTYLLREVRSLRSAGIQVVVAAVDGDDRPVSTIPLEDREERETTFVVKTRNVGAIVVAHAATVVTRPLKYAAGLQKAMALAGADLKRIVSHLLYFGEAVVAGRYFWRAGCAHVHTHYATTVAVIGACVYPAELSATIHGSAEFIDPRAQRLREKVAACAFVRAISLYGRSQLMLATPLDEWPKFEVMRLGVDPDAFQPAPFRPSPDPFQIVAVGQLQPAKGFHVLLEAIAGLVRNGRNVGLTLVGDGPDRDPLRAHAARLGLTSHVTFTGALTQPEVRTVLRDSDAFVLSSFAEGVPVVLMEAMASELACVATRITGIPELIEDGRDGLLVTPSDQDALAVALATLMDEPARRRELGCAARRKICREYNLHVNLAPLLQAFAARLTPKLDR